MGCLLEWVMLSCVCIQQGEDKLGWLVGFEGFVCEILVVEVCDGKYLDQEKSQCKVGGESIDVGEQCQEVSKV